MLDMQLKANHGEWSEVYIFFKLMYDRKIYAADINMNKLDDVFLIISRIIGENLRKDTYWYCPGDIVKIYVNSIDSKKDIQDNEFAINRDKVFSLMQANKKTKGTYGDDEVEAFLKSIFIEAIKAPSVKSGDSVKGTQDITMEVVDYRSSISRIVSFSCKSDFGGNPTLFNASVNNTNFVYEIVGPVDDTLMDTINSMFTEKGNTATGDRIQFLKDSGCDLVFFDPYEKTAKRNLVLSGGNELPSIVGSAIKFFYWEGNATMPYSSLRKAIDYVINQNPAKYEFEDIESIYESKFKDLLYNMFTGMKMSKPWNGRSSINGGYITMKDDGEVLAYHSCITDEFKDFLLNRLRFEGPSNKRHNAMYIYKANDKYYINFNLQIRFS